MPQKSKEILRLEALEQAKRERLAAVAKELAQLKAQRGAEERRIRRAQQLAAGQLAEQCGINIDDLGALEVVFKRLAPVTGKASVCAPGA